MMANGKKLIIGSEEWCGFSTLGVPAIKARVDSGAKTSSIHAFDIKVFKRKGERWVRFDIHPLQKNRKTNVRCEAPVVDRRSVKSSSGESGKRYVIRAPMVIGGHEWEVELTLANRDSMGYRMLLGREAMSNRVLIDPSDGFLLGDIDNDTLAELYRKKGRKQ